MIRPELVGWRKQSVSVLIGELRRLRFAQGFRCARCGGKQVQRWGSFCGRQRYRCKDCNRTFSDFTGTPAAYVKKLRELNRYRVCMAEGVTVRAAAREVGVHRCTAFRWRHRLLDDLHGRAVEQLTGWIEFGWVRMAYSRKGQRGLRDARRRGLRGGEWMTPRRVSVWAALDRRGRLVTDYCLYREPFRTEVEAVLMPRVKRPVVFTDHRGRIGLMAWLARKHGLRYHRSQPPYWYSRAEEFQELLGGTMHTRQYFRRFKGWMRRFRGVATKYLENYLIWHLVWDRAERRGVANTVISWFRFDKPN